MTTAIRHAREKIPAHLAACLGPVGFALLVCVFLVLAGFVSRLGLGAALVGLFWFLPLVAALLAAALLVGILFGWPLVWGAINTERSDSFDAVSRAYAYAYQRPLVYLGLAALAALVGLLGWLLVWLVSEMILQICAVGVGLGASSEVVAELLGETEARSPLFGAGARLVAFWNGAVRTLASAYGFAYFWCAVAGIYLLLRLDVDAKELDDIPADDSVFPTVSATPGSDEVEVSGTAAGHEASEKQNDAGHSQT